SSERRVRTPSAENPRFPGSGQSPRGKSEPKARPKGAVDGKQVDIPAPKMWSDAGVEKDNESRVLVPVEGRREKRLGNRLFAKLKTDSASFMIPCLQEKLLSDEACSSVP